MVIYAELCMRRGSVSWGDRPHTRQDASDCDDFDLFRETKTTNRPECPSRRSQGQEILMQEKSAPCRRGSGSVAGAAAARLTTRPLALVAEWLGEQHKTCTEGVL